jgi:hypothetical protein
MSGSASPPAAATRRSARLLTVACVLALVGVVLSVAHLLWPTPLLFALFMLAGQGAYGAAMVLYGVVIYLDLRARKVL